MVRKKSPVPNRQYTMEFKIEAARLAESVGGSEASRRLGIPESSVWNWLRLKRKKARGGCDDVRGDSKAGERT